MITRMTTSISREALLHCKKYIKKLKVKKNTFMPFVACPTEQQTTILYNRWSLLRGILTKKELYFYLN